jgi:serine/threonine protein kinase
VAQEQNGTVIAQGVLGVGEHHIGRDKRCSIALDRDGLNQVHAKFILAASGIMVEELAGQGSVYLDGAIIQGRVQMIPGQVLQLGGVFISLITDVSVGWAPEGRVGGGRYTLRQLLGRGGMGEVWLAFDTTLGLSVALKKLGPALADDPEALRNLKHEVYNSLTLTHINIIRIYDIVHLPGEVPFISMEYVRGIDLHKHLKAQPDGSCSWVVIEPWIKQLVEALRHAHNQKIVHRDLKPGNIFLGENNVIKLGDFGIAGPIMTSASGDLQRLELSGTLLFMSPQQLRGIPPRESDDIYAFGATIYMLLTGSPPFDTGDDIAKQVENAKPMSLKDAMARRGIKKHVPSYVSRLVRQCLAKEPTGRPMTMAAISHWLDTEGGDSSALPEEVEGVWARIVRGKRLIFGSSRKDRYSSAGRVAKARELYQEGRISEVERDHYIKMEEKPWLGLAVWLVLPVGLFMLFFGEEGLRTEDYGGLLVCFGVVLFFVISVILYVKFNPRARAVSAAVNAGEITKQEGDTLIAGSGKAGGNIAGQQAGKEDGEVSSAMGFLILFVCMLVAILGILFHEWYEERKFEERKQINNTGVVEGGKDLE